MPPSDPLGDCRKCGSHLRARYSTDAKACRDTELFCPSCQTIQGTPHRPVASTRPYLDAVRLGLAVVVAETPETEAVPRSSLGQVRADAQAAAVEIQERRA